MSELLGVKHTVVRQYQYGLNRPVTPGCQFLVKHYWGEAFTARVERGKSVALARLGVPTQIVGRVGRQFWQRISQ